MRCPLPHMLECMTENKTTDTWCQLRMIQRLAEFRGAEQSAERMLHTQQRLCTNQFAADLHNRLEI